MHKIIDLYSGCGGFGLGAELAGFTTRIAIDIDTNLQSSYSKNFNNCKVLNADISQLSPEYWKSTLNGTKVDGVIGGPPCQGFSCIGKREKSDPRNSLISHFYNQVAIIRPKFFIMENVQGLLDAGNIDKLYEGFDLLPNNYRVIEPMILNAADYGAATDRKRVVVIGFDPDYVDDMTATDFAPPNDIKQINVRDAISDLPKPLRHELKNDYHWGTYPKTVGRRKHYISKCRAMPGRNLGWKDALLKLSNGMTSGLSPTVHSARVVKRFKDLEPGKVDKVSKFPKLKLDEKCPTLRAGTGKDRGGFQSVRPIHPSRNRVITVREAARLQGFPDWFIFHPTKWHSFRMIGNSVSPPVSEYLHKVILKNLS